MDDSDLPEKGCDSNFDVISNLPECIKEKILEYLPTKEAVKTCVLSKDWTHTWSHVNVLYIDFGRHLAVSTIEEDLKKIKLIDQVLRHHSGNVRVLKIGGVTISDEDFERWMLKFSQMQIRDLILELDCRRKWSRQTCLATGLCTIKLPKDFAGFIQLQSLRLNGECKISETDMTKLISSCPLLQKLVLDQFSYGILKIHALNLQEMSILGGFGDLYLQTPKLMKACIVNTCRLTIATMKVVFGRNLIQALNSITQIQYMSIYCHYPEPLVESLQANIPLLLGNLTKMHICLQPSDAQLTFALFMFQNSPKLQHLSLEFPSFISPPVSRAYKRKFYSSEGALFSSLRNLYIVLDQDSYFSMELIKLVLKNAPVLHKIIIWDEDWTESKLGELKGLSDTAKIIHKKWWDRHIRDDIELYF